MELIETRWWALPVSDEWHTETDGGTVIISDQDDVGSLELTVLELDMINPGAEDLRELAAQVVPPGIDSKQVRCGQWQGILFEYSDEDFCRDWFLHDQHCILLISYTCALEHRGMDDAAVDQMLAELQAGGEADALK